MTKAEMIEKYGEQYYEDFKARCRAYMFEKYHADPDKARTRMRASDAKHKSHKREYAQGRRVIYRINIRDNLRLSKMGVIQDGYEAHHVKYHSDNRDKTWIDDIVIMPREEHRKWHREHPDFNALEHVV